MNMFSEVGFWFYFVLFLQEGATKPELVEKESDANIIERAPQGQANHDHLTSVDRTRENDRSGKLVNACKFCLYLKANIKTCKWYRSKFNIHFILSALLLLSFFRSVPPTTNFFFLKMLQPSEILFHYFILLKHLWIEVDLHTSLKFIVVNALINVSVTAFYRHDVSPRTGRRERCRITLGF